MVPKKCHQVARYMFINLEIVLDFSAGGIQCYNKEHGIFGSAP